MFCNDNAQTRIAIIQNYTCYKSSTFDRENVSEWFKWDNDKNMTS